MGHTQNQLCITQGMLTLEMEEKNRKKGEKTAGLELGSWVGKKFGKTPLFI